MTKLSNLSELEQETYRSTVKDGLMELFLGMTLLILSNVYYNTWSISLMVLFVIIIFPKATEKIRERYIYTRIGYVKVKPDTEFEVIQFITFMVTIFSLAGILILLLPNGYDDTDNLYRIWPFILGMVMFGPAMHLQEKTGMDRYLFMGVLPTISGLLITVLSVIDEPWDKFEGIRIFTLLWGLLSLIFGVTMYVRFIKNHPIMEDEEIE
jgi:hypothetical protein